jgi:hypothetical protein
VEDDRIKKLPTALKNRLDTLQRLLCYDGDMLQGKCPKCGTYYYGWSLINPRHQSCPKCGVGLEITEDGHRLFIGYSPFIGERYFFNPANAPSFLDKEKGGH